MHCLHAPPHSAHLYQCRSRLRLCRQGKKWAGADASDGRAISERVWRLVRAGRLGDAKEMCRRCGQAWRAATLGSPSAGPVVLGAVETQANFPRLPPPTPTPASCPFALIRIFGSSCKPAVHLYTQLLAQGTLGLLQGRWVRRGMR